MAIRTVTFLAALALLSDSAASGPAGAWAAPNC